MKALKKQIKILAFTIVLMFSMEIYAQNESKTHNIFVRVYNLEGKKISNGSIIFINDSILRLKNNIENKNISMRDIGFINTKRSAGSNVLIGATSGAVLGAIIGASTADPNDWILGYTAGEGALLGGSLGALGGVAIGGLTSLLKNYETYIISANEMNWKSFQKIIKEKQRH